MFNMSGTELIIILVLALVLIGPEDLPRVARTVGKTIKQIQQAGDDLRDTFEREVMTEVKKPGESPLGAIAKAKDSINAIGASLTSELSDVKKPGDTSLNAIAKAKDSLVAIGASLAAELKDLPSKDSKPKAPEAAPEKPRGNA